MKDRFVGRERLIQMFREEGLESYRSIVSFFDEHREEISVLDFEDYFSMYVDYVEALYEIGAHHKFIREVDKLIEVSITKNIVYFEGRDIFQYFVLKKAHAYFNMGLLDKCEKVLLELLKMNPKNVEYKELYIKSRLKRKTKGRIDLRMQGAIVLMCSAVVIGVEIFVVRVFFDWLVSSFELLRNLLFLGGIVLMVYAEFSSWVDARNHLKEKMKLISKKSDS